LQVASFGSDLIALVAWGDRVAGIVETNFGLVEAVPALLARPDEAIPLIGPPPALDDKRPGTIRPPWRMRHVSG